MVTALAWVLAAMLGIAALTSLVADRTVVRRMRHPRLLQGACVAAAAVLVPAQLVVALRPTLADTHAGLRGAVVLLGVVALGTLGMAVVTQRVPTTAARLPRRILAVGAHPDDLELACGATLAKLADSGHEITAMTMSRGGAGGHAERRLQEARTGAALLGATRIEVLDFPDTRMADLEGEMTTVIERTIQRWNPDIILTHSASDQHQDHCAVHRATMRAARRHPAILCFESPSVTRSFSPSVYVDVEDYVDAKVAAVQAHRDQRGKPYMTSERIRGAAAFRGGEARVRHAEGFEPVRVLGSAIGEL